MARTVLVCTFVCLALILPPPAAAQASRKKEYALDISRQQLTRALEQLNLQTGLYYIYIPGSPEEERTLVGPLRGNYQIDKALTELLQSTELTFEWTAPKTVSIVQRPPPPKSPPAPQKPVRKVPEVPKADSRSSQTEGVILDEVTVVATRRSLHDNAAPVAVIGRETIERSGFTSIFDLMKLIPQQPFLRPDGFRSNGSQYVELRGLGPDTTLVVINGRRAFASAASFVQNAFDLNTIPLSAVERVEVLLDSTSVKYGSDAIGGILNIVLRDDIPHPTVEAYFGSTQGGGAQQTVSASAGYKGDSGSFALVADYSETKPLFGAERDLWANQDYRRFGSVDQRSINSSPGNVTAALPGDLPGLNSPIAAIPHQMAGERIALSELLPGQHNMESLLQHFPIVAGSRRASIVASGRAELTPAGTGVAAELMYVDRSVRFPFVPPIVPGLPVPGTNPFNPFPPLAIGPVTMPVPVLVNTRLEGIGPQQVNVESELLRGVVSMHGKLRAWEWETSLLRSEEDAEQWTDNLLDFARLMQVLANPDPSQTLNVFRPGPAASQEILDSIIAAPRVETFATDATQLNAIANGRVFELPAGPVTALVGGEWRKESVQFDAVLDSFEREVAAGFAQLTVPILGGRNDLSAPRVLSAIASARFDDYSDFGGFLNPQYGLVWRPHRDVTLRASYARSFRAPSMYELHLPMVRFDNFGPISDPRRGREPASVALLTGGNPALEATRGESHTLGLEFRPQAIEPLKLSASYWHIVMDNRVTPALQPTFVLANEALFPERVVRAEPTAAELAQGLPGRIVQVDTSRLNFGRLTTSGIDLGASYALESAFGRVGANVVATWIDKFETVDVQATAPASRINLANDTTGTITKWRAIASVDWQHGAIGATTRLRYIPSYDDTLGGVRNGRKVASQTFLDLQLSLDLEQLANGARWWRGFELAAGASNVLDEEPDFAEVLGAQGYDTSQGDLKGRFWYVRLGKSF